MTAQRSPRFSRRQVLTGLGASAALMPFVPLSSSGAATDGSPRRLVLLFSSNGTIHDNWKPSGSVTDFTFGPILEPLTPYQDRINVIDGLRIAESGAAGKHFTCMAGLWTGSSMGSDMWAQGPSVDQVVASRIGDQTPYASLEFGVQTAFANAGTKRHMSYAAPSQPLPAEDDPSAAFDRLFADVAGGPTPEQQQIRAERKSSIDFVKADIDRIRGHFGSEDKAKLDAHLDSIRNIENRLDDIVSCTPPELGSVAGYDNESNFPELTRLQMDLLVSALACGLTQVASLQLSHAQSFTTFTWLGQSDRHHYLSHLDHSSPSTIEQLTAIDVWMSEQVLYLLDALAAVPEGNGTMLDNTLVVWGHEMGKGQGHIPFPAPFMTAGGGNLGIPTGRNLTYDGMDHNRLLVSICEAMGLDDVTTFGTLDTGSGGLPDFV